MSAGWGRRAALVLLTVAVILQVPRYGGGALTVQVLQLLVGLLLVLGLARVPEIALLIMVVLVPVQQVVLALLLSAAHLPVPLIKGLGLTKELCVAAMLLAAVLHGERRAPDLLDKLALSFVGLVSFYLVLPLVIESSFVPLPFEALALGWRSNALFVVAFLAARRMPLTEGFRKRLTTAVIAVAIVSCAGALVEFFASDTWTRFLTETARLRHFRAVIQDDLRPATDELVRTVVAGREVIRVGGLSLSPLLLGFVLLVPLGLLLEQLSGSRRRVLSTCAAALVAAGVVLTLTRSAILGAIVMALLTLRLGITRKRPGRVQLGVGLALGALLLAPLAGSSSVADRFTSAFNGDESAEAHRTGSLQGLSAVVADPVGQGLGTAPGVGDRAGLTRVVTSENAYLQVGVELGLAAMILFILLMLSLLRQLYRRSLHEDEQGRFASALFVAGVGLAIGGLFLHVWLGLGTALTFWPLAGIALSYRGEPAPPGEVDSEPQRVPIREMTSG